ncbi:MAG TPA: hypothetical protein VMQ54_10670 [Steroidobacteraceae bacterium]|jgi:hypothetical protein|nr:hypothetical protein [Steroidobacteraceae bacterium]
MPRVELYAVLDRYLAALEARDPARLAWHARAKTSENNVVLERGDGLWGTITGRGGYDLRFADETTGQVGFFGSVVETRDESPLTLRIAVREGVICEVETLVVRAADSGIRFPAPRYAEKPMLNEWLPSAERATRAELTAAADGYFATLERNDGTLHVEFTADCNRVENGVQTTHNPELDLVPVARFGCETQFRLGHYRYDDRLRARRFPLIDVERGLVLAGAFIDHCGRVGRYRLTDGTEAESPVRRPHSFYMLELFCVRSRKIRQIEANFITVPYHMPSPWEI